MPDVEFTPQERAIGTKKLQAYCSKELDMDLGQFDAQFLLEFFEKEIGAYYYNRGLYDAQALLSKRVDSITDAIYDLEKPTEFDR